MYVNLFIHLYLPLSDVLAFGLNQFMAAAQVLIQKKYPNIKGLQSPILGETLTFDVHPAGVNFVQVLNVNRSHWIMVTSIGCSKPNEVRVYDSLPSCDVPFRTKQQISSLLFSKCHEIQLVFPTVQQQHNSSDCGLFALAFAVSLCAGNDPSNTTYIQSNLRSHLLSCLDLNDISLFPTRKQKRSARKAPITPSFNIYCICRLPEEGKMIECEKCLEWFHKDCVHTIPSNWRKSKKRSWFCDKCITI